MCKDFYSDLHLVHPVHDVEHLLEDTLQAEVHLQPLPAGLQQLQQILPQAQHVVFARRDSLDIVIVFSLQLSGHGHHRLHSLLICRDIRLNGFMFFGCCLDRLEVESEIVLQKTEENIYMLKIIMF